MKANSLAVIYSKRVVILGMGERAYRFRLYPSGKQERKLLGTLEACRHLWNDALSHRKRRWEEERLSTSYYLQQWILTEERKHDSEFATVYSQVSQDILHRLGKAFKAFF